MASQQRRALYLPDPAFATAELRPVADTGGTPQEAGLSVRQPTIGGFTGINPAPEGDIRPTVSGLPEIEVDSALRLALAGPVEEGRYGWGRRQDSETSNLQLRQNPNVCGRRADCLARDTNASDPTHFARPKILSARVRATTGTVQDYLLAIWLQSDVLMARSGATGPGNKPIQTSRILLDDESRWEAPNDAIEINGELDHVMAVDAVHYPDTDEVIACVAAVDDPASPADRRIYTFHSQEGVTFRTRARLLADGSDPDISLIAPGPTADASVFKSLAVERLPSGRLVCLLLTDEMLWSLTSDDRGHSLTPSLVTDANITGGTNSPGATVACVVARNGVLMAVWANPSTTGGDDGVWLAMSADGITWSTPIRIWSGSTPPDATSPLGVTIAIRPDGFPVVYMVRHGAAAGLRQIPFRTRDPALDDGIADLIFSLDVVVDKRFHGTEGASLGALANGPFTVDDFHELDATLWRGQLVIVAHNVIEEGESEPTYVENALSIHRTNHWQPLIEKLAANTGGRTYNHTWDCYTDPRNRGYTAVAIGGTDTGHCVSDGVGTPGRDEGGFWEIDTPAAATRYFSDLTLPNAASGYDGACRTVMMIDRHVSPADDVRLQLILNGGAVVVHGVEIAFNRISADAFKVKAFDFIGGGQIGSTIDFVETGDGGRWYEAIAAIWEDAGGTSRASVFVRPYRRDTDPDWDERYSLVAISGTITKGVGVESVSFGNAVVDAESRWKTVQVHRAALTFPIGAAESPLQIATHSFVDDELTSTEIIAAASSSSGHQRVDDGLLNFVRGAMMTANPPQYLERGVRVSWRGRAQTEGGYEFAADFDYRGEHVEEPPVVMREWRSVEGDSTSAIEFVWVADESRCLFRPNAVALFGRNFHNFSIGLWDTDPALGGTADVLVRVGVEGDPVVHDRKSHLWATDLSDGWHYYAEGNRLTVFRGGAGTPEAASPWRPHEFASSRTGAKFYLYVQRNSGLPYIYRIEDNTEDTLCLRTAAADEIGTPLEVGRLYNEPIAIFSDRCALEFEHQHPASANGLITHPHGHVRGYKYLRFAIGTADHRDADEDFVRLGRLVLGTVHRLDLPDYEWGWSMALKSGTDVEDLPSGITIPTARHVPRRIWQVSRNLQRAPREADAVVNSPDASQGDRAWVEFAETARRLLVADQDVALIWDAQRSEGDAAERNVQIAAHYHELALVRVTGPGTARHRGYLGQTMNLPLEDECAFRAVATVSGIEFTEIL